MGGSGLGMGLIVLKDVQGHMVEDFIGTSVRILYPFPGSLRLFFPCSAILAEEMVVSVPFFVVGIVVVCAHFALGAFCVAILPGVLVSTTWTSGGLRTTELPCVAICEAFTTSLDAKVLFYPSVHPSNSCSSFLDDGVVFFSGHAYDCCLCSVFSFLVCLISI